MLLIFSKNHRGQSGLFSEIFAIKLGINSPNNVGLLGWLNNIFLKYKGQISNYKNFDFLKNVIKWKIIDFCEFNE